MKSEQLDLISNIGDARVKSSRAHGRNLVLLLIGVVSLAGCLWRGPLGSVDIIPHVHLDYGTFIGRREMVTGCLVPIVSYLGIPYAEAPTGHLRFRPPVSPPTGEASHIHEAIEYGPACPQQFTGSTLLSRIHMPVRTSESEDCLSINVQIAETGGATDLYPVVVWIHGGAFEIGSASTYDGASVVAQAANMNTPLIFVSFNYRLNGLGFLAGREVAAEGVGNLGLRDQEAALRWVQRYIHFFQGDRTKVTVLGESAGSISTALLMLTSPSASLFRGIFLQSGSPISVGSIDHGQIYFDDVARHVGCLAEDGSSSRVYSTTAWAATSETSGSFSEEGGIERDEEIYTDPSSARYTNSHKEKHSDHSGNMSSASLHAALGDNTTSVLDCLRQVPLSSLQDAIAATPSVIDYTSLHLAWMPRVDGKFLSDSPATLLSRGMYARVPVVSGDCDDEGTLFAYATANITTPGAVREYMHSNYLPDATDSELDTLMSLYPDDPTLGSPFGTGELNQLTPQSKRLAALQGDLVFQAPRRAFLESIAGTQPVWSYLYKRNKHIAYLGSFHGSDLKEIFGRSGFVSETDLCRALVRFVVYQDPNGPPSATGVAKPWPLWTPEKRHILTYVDGIYSTSYVANDTFRDDAIQFIAELSRKYPI